MHQLVDTFLNSHVCIIYLHLIRLFLFLFLYFFQLRNKFLTFGHISLRQLDFGRIRKVILAHCLDVELGFLVLWGNYAFLDRGVS